MACCAPELSALPGMTAMAHNSLVPCTHLLKHMLQCLPTRRRLRGTYDPMLASPHSWLHGDDLASQARRSGSKEMVPTHGWRLGTTGPGRSMTPQSTGPSTTAGSSPSLPSFRSQAATREGPYLIQSDMALALSRVHLTAYACSCFWACGRCFGLPHVSSGACMLA